ncbi:MAG: hypothetical protein ACOX64_14280 [Candidatus Merdivicinus sp.]|jgi:hypothetical protein
MFYNFVLSMWVAGTITEEKVRSYVPKYITAEQAEMILATPQR